jgi:hypothetical protein
MFEIFRDAQGNWWARRRDGLVGGIFRDRAEAERFARLESAPAQPQRPRLVESLRPVPPQRAPASVLMWHALHGPTKI